MRARRSSRLSLLAAAAGAFALLAGCGGGDDNGGGGDASGDVPEPAQPIAAQAAAFEQATSNPTCANALKVVQPAVLPKPETPDAKENCASAVSRVKQFNDFKVSKSQEYGSAAIVEGTRNGQQRAALFALDPDGVYKWTSSDVVAPQIGTKPAAGADFKRPADDFVAAIRAGDCKAAYATIAPGSRLDYGSEKEFCKLYKSTFEADASKLGSLLADDTGAEPVSMGETAALGFFGLATDPSGFRTIIVDTSGTGGRDPRVFDVVPGPST